MVSLTIELEFEACLLVGANDGKRSVETTEREGA